MVWVMTTLPPVECVAMESASEPYVSTLAPAAAWMGAATLGLAAADRSIGDAASIPTLMSALTSMIDTTSLAGSGMPISAWSSSGVSPSWLISLLRLASVPDAHGAESALLHLKRRYPSLIAKSHKTLRS